MTRLVRAPHLERFVSAISHAVARLSEPADVLVCATSDGRALWQPPGEMPSLLPQPGRLNGALIFRDPDETRQAQIQADLWNALNPADPVEVVNLNVALARASGLKLRTASAPNVLTGAKA